MQIIFFSCGFTHNIWKKWYSILGISFALPNHAKQHFLQNGHGLSGSNSNLSRLLGWSVIVWNIRTCEMELFLMKFNLIPHME